LAIDGGAGGIRTFGKEIAVNGEYLMQKGCSNAISVGSERKIFSNLKLTPCLN